LSLAARNKEKKNKEAKKMVTWLRSHSSHNYHKCDCLYEGFSHILFFFSFWLCMFIACAWYLNHTFFFFFPLFPPGSTSYCLNKGFSKFSSLQPLVCNNLFPWSLFLIYRQFQSLVWENLQGMHQMKVGKFRTGSSGTFRIQNGIAHRGH
jgi:hypothetical protein